MGSRDGLRGDGDGPREAHSGLPGSDDSLIERDHRFGGDDFEFDWRFRSVLANTDRRDFIEIIAAAEIGP